MIPGMAMVLLMRGWLFAELLVTILTVSTTVAGVMLRWSILCMVTCNGSFLVTMLHGVMAKSSRMARVWVDGDVILLALPVLTWMMAGGMVLRCFLLAMLLVRTMVLLRTDSDMPPVTCASLWSMSSTVVVTGVSLVQGANPRRASFMWPSGSIPVAAATAHGWGSGAVRAVGARWDRVRVFLVTRRADVIRGRWSASQSSAIHVFDVVAALTSDIIILFATVLEEVPGARLWCHVFL
jgi:hypothetical protein